MERCKTLINKLLEQSENNTDASVMMITAQLLQVEIAKLIENQPVHRTTSGVSVMLPAFRNIPVMPHAAIETVKEAPTAQHSEVVGVQDVVAIEEPEVVVIEQPPVAPIVTIDKKPAIEERELLAVTEAMALASDVIKLPQEKADSLPDDMIFPVAPISTEREVWVLDPVLETPTLAHQDEIKELNEMMGKLSNESLNDRLKNARSDISSFLTDAPVRDLKKAIGINDRFLFVNELFRGDVDMYERSIKTINNFRILAEAEYWIERELKIKLGWDVASEAAAQFNHLVRRRFS